MACPRLIFNCISHGSSIVFLYFSQLMQPTDNIQKTLDDCGCSADGWYRRRGHILVSGLAACHLLHLPPTLSNYFFTKNSSCLNGFFFFCGSDFLAHSRSRSKEIWLKAGHTNLWQLEWKSCCGLDRKSQICRKNTQSKKSWIWW